jgi:hypothetical protein
LLVNHPKTRRRPLEIFSNAFLRVKYFVLTEISEVLHKRRYRNFRPSYDSDAVVHGIDRYVASLAAFLDRGNMEMFLKRLAELTVKLLPEPLKGRALFVPELDELTRRASTLFRVPASAAAKSKCLVHVATEVYLTGGHTRVIEDVVAALPEYEHSLIITRPETSELDSLRSRFDQAGLKVHLLQALSRIERTRELSSLISELRPEAVLLFAHQYDSIAYVGVTPDAAPRVLFIHHGDHRPSLGASRADYVHVDVTPECHRVCASHPILNASLLNLTADDIGTVSMFKRYPIFGVTCGSSHKYEGASEFTYAQLLAEMFSAGVHRILHIGNMPASQEDQIRANIALHGQDSSRIVFLPNTTSLAAKLKEISPDFYLTSHPLGSGKATLEAMSVGLPILYICPASTPSLLNSDMTFGASVSVSTLDQVAAAVRRLDTERESLGKGSRAVYEKYYSQAAFREGLLSVISSSDRKNSLKRECGLCQHEVE